MADITQIYKGSDGSYYVPDSRFSGQFIPFKPGITTKRRISSGAIEILDLPSSDAVTKPMSYREEVAAGVDVNADRTLGFYGLKPPEDNTSTRNQGESISDFTQRLDSNISQQDYFLKPGESIDAYNSRIAKLRGGSSTPTTGGASSISQADYQLKPGESISSYNARIASLRGETSGSSSGTGASSGGASTGSQGGYGGGTSSIVGTSASERLKELQRELGVGSAPEVPDYFTSAMAKELALAKGDRTAINNELAQILNERLAMDEEMQKFAINAGEGTTEAGRIGAVSEAQRNANERLQVLNRRELVLETKLSNRNQVISELMGLERQEYADASAQYERNFGRALQLYNVVQEEASELKQNASANLSVLADVYKAKIDQGMDISSISRSGRRQLEELEAQSGRPIGSTLALLQAMKPQEKELFSKMDDNGNFYQIYQTPDGSVKTRVMKTGYTDTSGQFSGVKEVQGGLYDLKTGQWIVGPKVATGTTSGTVGGGGKPVSSATALNLADSQAAMKMLTSLSSTINSQKSLFGPVKGRISGANPYATQAQAVQATINATKQIVGKYLEGGVLRQEDEVKYEKILPKLSDTPAVALSKLNQVKALVQSKIDAQREGLSSAGYNTGLAPTDNVFTTSDGNEWVIN